MNLNSKNYSLFHVRGLEYDFVVSKCVGRAAQTFSNV